MKDLAPNTTKRSVALLSACLFHFCLTSAYASPATSSSPSPSSYARSLILDAMKGSYGSACIDLTSHAPSSTSIALDRISSVPSVTLDCSDSTSTMSVATEFDAKLAANTSTLTCSASKAGVTKTLGLTTGGADPSAQFISLSLTGSAPSGLYCSASPNFSTLTELKLRMALLPILKQTHLPYRCAGPASPKPSDSTFSFDGKTMSLLDKTYDLTTAVRSEQFIANANSSSLKLVLGSGETITLAISKDGKGLGLITYVSSAGLLSCLPK